MLSVCSAAPAVGITPKSYGFAIVNTWTGHCGSVLRGAAFLLCCAGVMPTLS
jgi:hypothetical protein